MVGGARLLIPRFSARHFSQAAVLGQRGGRGAKVQDSLTAATILEDEKRGVFREQEVLPPKREARKQFRRFDANQPVPPARSATMRPDQRWGDVWPATRTFHPAVVPLPVRQGVVQTKEQVVPSKWANAELMKVTNFLHLTPPVVAEHCSAIAKFCTEWPKGLETEEEVDQHFPLTVITSDHLSSSSSIRDRRARIVTLRFNVDALELDEHARDKFVRLVGERMEEASGVVTITADRCPYRGQNMDYSTYLVTALYHESWRVEEWERKEEADLEVFAEEEGRGALEELINRGEDDAAVARYREEVRELLGLPPLPVAARAAQ